MLHSQHYDILHLATLQGAPEQHVEHSDAEHEEHHEAEQHGSGDEGGHGSGDESDEYKVSDAEASPVVKSAQREGQRRRREEMMTPAFRARVTVRAAMMTSRRS